MKLLPESVHIFVGGGITSASESEKEWKETVLKSQNMLKVLDL
jgi:isochorismate synthase